MVADVDAKGAEETVRLVERAGGEATFVRTDVSQSREVQAMLKQGSGSIVNIGSGNEHAAAPGIGAYVAAKRGLLGLTAVAALDYGDRNIRVNAVGPGTMVTPSMRKALDENPKHKAFLERLAPIKRFSDPHEVAEAVIWLCSDKASFVVGHTLVADGGACAGKLLKPA